MERYNIREIAVKILLGVEKGGFVTDLINRYGKELNDKESGLLYDLVYGTLRNRIYIDKIIEKYSSISLKRLEKLIIIALRIGVYQFLIRGEPDYASVDSVVSIVSGKQRKAFVNAVMRKFTSRTDFKDILPGRDKNPVEYLSVRYSEELIFTDEMLKFLGFNSSEKVMEYLNKVPNTFIRVNKNITDYEEVMRLFLRENINLKPVVGFIDFLYSDTNIRGLFDTDTFKSGYITVLDISQGIAPLIASKIGGNIIGDLCSGPGGKALYMSDLMGEKVSIISIDMSVDKINLMKENIKRMKNRNIYGVCSDLKDIKTELFDIAILDVPCSNSGNFGKHPEARYRLNRSKIRELVNYQRELFESAIGLVKKGGFLLYCTCSIMPSECHLLIESEIAKNKNLEPVDLKSDDRFNEILNNGDFVINEYGIYVMPNSFKDVISGGGFVSVIKRAKSQ